MELSHEITAEIKREIFENIRNLHESNIDIPGVTNKTDKSHPFSY